jgi:hypothetical protein
VTGLRQAQSRDGCGTVGAPCRDIGQCLLELPTAWPTVGRAGELAEVYDSANWQRSMTLSKSESKNLPGSASKN